MGTKTYDCFLKISRMYFHFPSDYAMIAFIEQFRALKVVLHGLETKI